MKFTKTFIIWAIVIVIHFIFFSWLISSDDKHDVAETEPVTNVENVAGQNEPKGDAGESVDTSVKPEPVPTTDTSRPTEPGNATLPASLNQKCNAAKAILVIDQDKWQVLYSKSANQQFPIASLSKLMTCLLLMEDVSAKKISLSDTVKTTSDDRTVFKRWGHGCWIDAGETYTMQDLLKAMIISSANDCAYLVARQLNGTHANFVARMNERARQLGLSSLHFVSCNGHPNLGGNVRKENLGSAMDVAILANQASRYPEIMKWAGTKRDRIRENAKNPFDLSATNHLLRDNVAGVTGLKTGYTDASGYCIVVTCERNGRHIMVVILGVDASDRGKQRDALAKSLLDWAYN